MKWQPIETAPLNPPGRRDGPEVLIWDAYSGREYVAAFGFDGDSRIGCWYECFHGKKITTPTHWKNKSEPPND